MAQRVVDSRSHFWGGAIGRFRFNALSNGNLPLLAKTYFALIPAVFSSIAFVNRIDPCDDLIL
jgi:hypothetical protein